MARKSKEALAAEEVYPDQDKDLEVSLPDPPAHLDRSAKALWKKLGETLLKMRMVTEADWLSLAALCADWSLYLECSKTLAEEGFYFTTNTGYKSLHPLVSVRNQSLDRALRVANQYGLTPTSRLRLKGNTTATGKEDFDPFLDE